MTTNRFVTISCGVLGLCAGVYLTAVLRSHAPSRSSGVPTCAEQAVDEGLEMTFPASDPPAHNHFD